MDSFNFNDNYGSFAYIESENSYHANLYMNVDSAALDYIIEYVQKRIINKKIISSEEIDQLIDLATLFAMPDLVDQLRKKIPPESYVTTIEFFFKNVIKLIVLTIYEKKHIVCEEDKINLIIDNFFIKNKQMISTIIVNLYNSKQYWFEFLQLCIQFYNVTLSCQNPIINLENTCNEK